VQYTRTSIYYIIDVRMVAVHTLFV